MMFKKSRILTILAIVTTICSFRAEARTATMPINQNAILQHMRVVDANRRFMEARKAGYTCMKDPELLKTYFEVLPEILQMVATDKLPWQVKDFRGQKYVYFGTASQIRKFSDAQQRAALLIQSLVSNNKDTASIARLFEDIYGGEVFNSAIVKQAQEWNNFVMLNRIGNKLGNVKLKGNSVEFKYDDNVYVRKCITSPITDVTSYTWSDDPESLGDSYRSFRPADFNKYMESPYFGPKPTTSGTDSDDDGEDYTSAPTRRVKPTSSSSSPKHSKAPQAQGGIVYDESTQTLTIFADELKDIKELEERIKAGEFNEIETLQILDYNEKDLNEILDIIVNRTISNVVSNPPMPRIFYRLKNIILLGDNRHDEKLDESEDYMAHNPWFKLGCILTYLENQIKLLSVSGAATNGTGGYPYTELFDNTNISFLQGFADGAEIKFVFNYYAPPKIREWAKYMMQLPRDTKIYLNWDLEHYTIVHNQDTGAIESRHYAMAELQQEVDKQAEEMKKKTARYDQQDDRQREYFEAKKQPIPTSALNSKKHWYKKGSGVKLIANDGTVQAPSW